MMYVIYFSNKIWGLKSAEWYIGISMFHRAFFNSIIDKHQHMHFTFNSILV